MSLYIIYKVGIGDFQFNRQAKDHASATDNMCFKKIGMEIVSAIYFSKADILSTTCDTV